MKATSLLVDWLDSELAARHWLKQELSMRSGVSATTIGRILMRKRQTISDDAAHKIAGVLGVDFRTLLDISEGRAVRTLGEHGATYTAASDTAGRLAEWLRLQPAEVQQIVYATARLHGFEKKVEQARAG
jgi:transcriptional regulator with XRE-family HTH domain